MADVDTDPAKAALIDAFVRFARGTGAVVCAEGIETAAELRVVADLDVTYGQGFGLARPSAPWADAVAVGLGNPVAPRAALLLRLPRPDERGDHALAQLVARLAALASPASCPRSSKRSRPSSGPTTSACCGCVDGGDALRGRLAAALAGLRHAPAGERHYGDAARTCSPPATRSTSSTATPAPTPGELALLRAPRPRRCWSPRSIGGRAPAGVLMLLNAADRRWSRAEVSRARIAGYALAPLLGQHATPALAVVPGDALP